MERRNGLELSACSYPERCRECITLRRTNGAAGCVAENDTLNMARQHSGDEGDEDNLCESPRLRISKQHVIYINPYFIVNSLVVATGVCKSTVASAHVETETDS